MSTQTTELEWQAYLANELPRLQALLLAHRITLDEHQPHIKGERFLMQAVTTVSGRKLILLGKDATGAPIVVKAATDTEGRAELRHERTCRNLLHAINFSYENFHSPDEILFSDTNGYTIFVSQFIAQTSSFLERPLEEQFVFALQALKSQEQTRATTAKHYTQINRVFGSRTSTDYLTLFKNFNSKISSAGAFSDTATLLNQAAQKLHEGCERIEQYCGFLTHTDFVPHNFRISNDNILYLLDFSSLRFGNKHESWARFLNFMTLYNRPLETLLLTYIEKNRAPEERESLQLMRLFRLGEIITYYANTLSYSSGNLQKLNETRVLFWTAVLEAELKNERVSDDIVATYQSQRDNLRSDDEKERQQGLH